MKIYISGPITGVDNSHYRFEGAEMVVRNTFPNADIINPEKIGYFMPDSTTHDQYMNLSILLLDMCDSIVMLDGWRESTGACIEYGYALAKDLIIIKEKDLQESEDK